MTHRTIAPSHHRTIALLHRRTEKPQIAQMDADFIATSQFTAKTAKIAKNIAMAIAMLTHRTVAPSHGEIVDRRRFHRMEEIPM